MADQGTYGEIRAFSDFLQSFEDKTWAATSNELDGGWYMVSVNEGTLQQVVDEEGGIIQFLTDTGDNDNVVLMTGPFKPSNGGVVVEARFKVADDIANTALYVGFSETMALGTPVMPAEFDTATMTYNGSGGMVGLSWDSDATTNDWRALGGDGGAVSSNADANGTRANEAAVADEWDIVRVEIGPDGTGHCYLNERLIKSITDAVTPGDLQYAIIMCENRTGAALEFEVDYAYARGYRDWTA